MVVSLWVLLAGQSEAVHSNISEVRQEDVDGEATGMCSDTNVAGKYVVVIVMRKK